WRNRLFIKTIRGRISVGIECCLGHFIVTCPEPGADDLVRISFTVGKPSAIHRSGFTGEAVHRQIKAVPENLDGADLSCEAAAELFKYAVNLNKNTPEAVNIVFIIRGVGIISGKRFSAFIVVWFGEDGYVNAILVEDIEQVFIKFSY